VQSRRVKIAKMRRRRRRRRRRGERELGVTVENK
jgi:ribosomal protein L21